MVRFQRPFICFLYGIWILYAMFRHLSTLDRDSNTFVAMYSKKEDDVQRETGNNRRREDLSKTSQIYCQQFVGLSIELSERESRE